MKQLLILFLCLVALSVAQTKKSKMEERYSFSILLDVKGKKVNVDEFYKLAKAYNCPVEYDKKKNFIGIGVMDRNIIEGTEILNKVYVLTEKYKIELVMQKLPNK